MTWAHSAQIGTAANTTADSSQIAVTTTADANVGDILLLLVAKDNSTTGGGNQTAEVTNVTDSAGNWWRHAIGHTNAGAAQTTTHVAIWLTQVTTAMASGGTITVGLGAPGLSTSNDAQAAIVEQFTIATGSYASILWGEGGAGDATDPASITVSNIPNVAALWIYALASEGPVSDAFTADSDYTAFTAAGTSDATATLNQTILGGFRIQTATSDTINWTSDTADRDWAHVVLVLAEVIPKAQGIASGLINPSGLVG